MPTINQLIKNPRWNKKKRRINPILEGNPQLSGTCENVGKSTPRKPNSALRSRARVILSNKKKVTVYIPGEGHNLQNFSRILIHGGGAQDLSGVKLSIVRGWGDTEGVKERKQGRSLYGKKKEKVAKNA